MMTPAIPIKRIIPVALLSSVIIGVLVFAPMVTNSREPLPHFFREILLVILLILVLWTINIALVFISEQYSHGKMPAYARYLISFAVCIALTLLFKPGPRPVRIISRPPATVQPGFPRPVASIGKGQVMMPYLAIIAALNAIILLILDLTLLRTKKSGVDLENAELKIKNIEATNHRLKQQIHPHFLFNSLNTLKTLIKKEPDDAEDYLVNLSDFLRASLLSDTLNVVTLQEEMQLALNYLAMQKIRFADALEYSIHIPGPIHHTALVPVFSILPLLENALKHNILTKEFPLQIRITYREGRIYVVNNLQPRPTTAAGTGFGIQNLAERYKILSGDDIIIDKSGQTFSIAIKILDNANSHHRG